MMSPVPTGSIRRACGPPVAPAGRRRVVPPVFRPLIPPGIAVRWQQRDLRTAQPTARIVAKPPIARLNGVKIVSTTCRLLK